MRRSTIRNCKHALAALALGTALSIGAVATAATATHAAAAALDFEMMTWPEVKAALAQGKTTALIYNGGTEQRGPQNVNGGHTLMGHATVLAIAAKLGNAIAMPVLPYSVNEADPKLPGTIGLTGPQFLEINQQVAEQTIKNGFKTVVLMGDHGGGQRELKQLAETLSVKYAAQGVKIIYCDEVYQKANDDFDAWLAQHGYPPNMHAGIPDTAEMMYLGENKGWIRRAELPHSLGDPPPPPGTDFKTLVRPIDNGIFGDARRSTAALGKRAFDLKVDYAVHQIRELSH